MPTVLSCTENAVVRVVLLCSILHTCYTVFVSSFADFKGFGSYVIIMNVCVVTVLMVMLLN